jgi:O-antigen/teichoic acid export membrane protein
VSSPEAYAMVFALGAGIAGLLMAPALRLGARSTTPDPPGPMARSLVLLVSSTLLMQLVANLGPIVVAYRLPEQAAVAGAFAATFVLARIPLFLFAPVQAMLLPSLTRALAHGDTAAFRRRIVTTLGVIGVFAAAGAVLGGTVGPWAVRVLLGVPVPPSALVLVSLAVATGLMMACQMLQPALVAAGRQRRVVVAWGLGTLVFLGFLVSPLDPITGALVAQLVGPAVTAVVAGTALVALARGNARGGDAAPPPPVSGP